MNFPALSRKNKNPILPVLIKLKAWISSRWSAREQAGSDTRSGDNEQPLMRMVVDVLNSSPAQDMFIQRIGKALESSEAAQAKQSIREKLQEALVDWANDISALQGAPTPSD